MRTALRFQQVVRARAATPAVPILTFGGAALTFGGAALTFQPA